MKTKICPKCGIEKPLNTEHYYKDSRRKGGLRSYCKSCNKTNKSEYYQNNKEKLLKKSAEYRKNNKEKIAKKDAEYRKNNKEKLLKKSAEYYRKSDKERTAKLKAEYYQNNKETIRKQQTDYGSSPEKRRAARLRTAKWYEKQNTLQPACVYQIVNTANNKIYIGETLKGELRWKKHLTELRGNYHANHKLQADFNKLGEDAFEWSIIKEYPKDKDTLLLEEAKTIVKYRKEGKYLYNLTLTIDQVQLLEENK